MASIETLEKAHKQAQERTAEGRAVRDEAAAAVEVVVSKVADGAPKDWTKLGAGYAEAVGLAVVTERACAILARREHQALVAVHEARVAEAQGAAQAAKLQVLAAKQLADDAVEAVLRLVNGRDPKSRELKGAERESYVAGVHAKRAEMVSRAGSRQAQADTASRAARKAEEELAAVLAAAPQ